MCICFAWVAHQSSCCRLDWPAVDARFFAGLKTGRSGMYKSLRSGIFETDQQRQSKMIVVAGETVPGSADSWI